MTNTIEVGQILTFFGLYYICGWVLRMVAWPKDHAPEKIIADIFATIKAAVFVGLLCWVAAT